MGPRPKVKGACGFCHMREQTEESGLLYKSPDDDVAAHLNCMLFSPTLVTQCTPDEDSFGGFLLSDVKKEIARGRRLKCFFCKLSGATIGCDVGKCKKSFHYLCAKKCSSEFVEDEDRGIYKIYCDRHKDNKTSNGEEDCGDSNGANISTDDDQMDELYDDDASDDSTFNGDDENELILRSNKQTKNGVENTPKRNLLKRASAIPQGSSGKVTNNGSNRLDVSGNSTVPTPSSVLGAKSKPQDGSRMVTERTAIPKKRIRFEDSDSSAPSTSTFLEAPVPEILIDENERVEIDEPQWFDLLSWYSARLTEQSHMGGQNNTMKPRDFWQLSRKAKCTEALFEKMIASLESRMQRIKSKTASEDDLAKVFNVLMTTGCLQTIAEDVKKEIKDHKEALEREKENLYQKERLLNEILPTLNRSTASEVSNETA